MKVMVVGPMWRGSNALSLADGVAELGHDVRSVDTTALSRPRRLSPDWVLNRADRADRLARRHRLLDGCASIAREWRPDVLLCFKTVHLDQDRLLALPVPVRISYSPDDVSNPANVSDDYLAHEARWSMVVTTKRHNVAEVTARTGGRTAVRFVLSAYDPAWHRPRARAGSARGFDVGFVGHFRPDRAPLLALLAGRHGRRLGIFGDGWRRRALTADGVRRAAVHGPAYAECFSAAVARTRANLVLLNSANRDTHTCRTFEVPAAGGLVVGERTDEHRALFDEGTEALLFSGTDELLAVLDAVARDPGRAARIAGAGHRRVLAGHHRYRDRAAEILAEVGA